jgi:hypothetical protein
MFSFTYDYCDHPDYLKLLATALNVPVRDNTVWLPKAAGSGYVKVAVLSNGLQVLMNVLCTRSFSLKEIKPKAIILPCGLMK